MSLTTFIRDIQQLHEAIPTPGAIIYNAIPVKLLREPERKIAKAIVERMESGTLIDIGSGTGYLSIEIAKRAPKLKVYGIDLSKEMVRISRKHAKEVGNVQFEICNAADLIFEDNSIDFIVSTGSLHHWSKPINVFNECYRVLREDREAWIYDGYPNVPKEEAEKVKKAYGFLRYQVLTKLQKLHGFTREEYGSRIKNILDQTAFKDSYQMERIDIWMKITLKKQRGRNYVGKNLRHS